MCNLGLHYSVEINTPIDHLLKYLQAKGTCPPVQSMNQQISQRASYQTQQPVSQSTNQPRKLASKQAPVCQPTKQQSNLLTCPPTIKWLQKSLIEWSCIYQEYVNLFQQAFQVTKVLFTKKNSKNLKQKNPFIYYYLFTIIKRYNEHPL